MILENVEFSVLAFSKIMIFEKLLVERHVSGGETCVWERKTGKMENEKNGKWKKWRN